MRKSNQAQENILVVCNFTPHVHGSYRIGVPNMGLYREVFNSDWEEFGGSGQQNKDNLVAEDIQWHNKQYSITLTVPPLATIYLKCIQY